MAAYTQHESPTIAGLMVVINHQTGAVYATRNALARLIDKPAVYVTHHAKTLSEGGANSEVFEAEVLTEGGLQGVTLYDENFICSLLMKYKQSLCLAAMLPENKERNRTEYKYLVLFVLCFVSRAMPA